MQVKAFVIDHLEEVHNKIGGVIGYELHLSADETEQLLKLVEATQPYLEVAEKARQFLKADDLRAEKRQSPYLTCILPEMDALRAAVDKLK